MALIKKIPPLLLILLVPFIYTAYQYWLRDSLQIYDASSHLAQISFLKEYLWPGIAGFNSFNLLGFDQGLLYPSLFHYTAATLGFLTGIEAAAKLIIITALLLLPLSVYLLTSIFFVSRNSRIFVTGMLLVVLVALPGYLGADIKGLIQVGLIPSFISLPLVFLFLWSLLKPKSNWILTALLLALIILTHLVAGIFCAVALLSFIATRLITKKFNLFLFKPAVFAFGLAGFFIIPFIFNYQLLSQSVHLPSLLLPNIVVVIILIILTVIFWLKKKERLYPIVILSLVLALIVLSDAVVLRYLNSSFLFEKIYNLHIYRYQVYLYLLTTFLVAYWPSRFLFEFPRRSKIKPEFIAILPIFVLTFASFLRSPFLVDQAKVNVTDNGVPGRFIELFSREDSYPFIYSSQNKLVLEKNKPWAYGLFTDATPNGPYLGSLIRSFDPLERDVAEERFVERKKLDSSRLYDMLDLFGIENLLLFDPNQTEDVESLNTRVLKSGVGKNLVEIPKWELQEPRGVWDSAVRNWWFSKGKLDSLLVQNPEKKISATSSARIKNLRNSKNWTDFSFEIESADKVPVLVKFTHLPGWLAKANGEKIEIHKTSPNLMLIYAKGKVEFIYQKLWYQKLGIVVSLFTLVLLILLGFRKSDTKNVKR